MLRKHAVLFGIIISLSLLFVAIQYYPGGSQFDKNAVGYSWKNNYLSNLFGPKAVNGMPNASRPWAAAGMLLFAMSVSLFFIVFSKKIPLKGAAKIVRYCGIGAMIAAFLAVTPYHDLMITVGSTLYLISMFYVTVFIFKSRLNLFKILSVVCLLVFYSCLYSYNSGAFIAFLPVLQKITIAITIAWILSLQYFTTTADFKPRKI